VYESGGLLPGQTHIFYSFPPQQRRSGDWSAAPCFEAEQSKIRVYSYVRYGRVVGESRWSGIKEGTCVPAAFGACSFNATWGGAHLRRSLAFNGPGRAATHPIQSADARLLCLRLATATTSSTAAAASWM